MRATSWAWPDRAPQDWTSPGTDGFGLSDSRAVTRRHFGVDAESVTVAALTALTHRGEVKAGTVRLEAERHGVRF
ncbi:hypothetical protein [Kitasatospora aureofaciens]|uniref:hypothetical protein n=1 Tax=Kitasatospora aureofaciens TaxID=1894 RepID=UPI003F4CC63B